jgi:acyl-CoA synthetase (AMP-forming)/AMP-acid ligase II
LRLFAAIELMLILDLIADRVRQRASAPFAHYGGRTVTYGEFDRLTNQSARALGELGVRKGDRVSVAMGNSIDYLVAAFGILKAGAVYNPVNPALGAGELSYIFGHAEPRIILTDADNVGSVVSPKLTLPAGTRVLGFDTMACESFSKLVAAQADTPCGVRVEADDGSTLLYTSGTTGNPKGVVFHHRSTGAAGKHFLTTLGINADDTILAVTPLFHGNAWGAVVTALQAGGTIAFPRAFRASEFWSLATSTHATVLYTLGTILAILLAQPPSEEEKRNSLRVILGLGSASIRDRIIERFGVEHVAECFGSTDAGVVTITPLGAAPREGSAGPPVSGVELRIVDDAGQPLPTRAVGEITVRSPHCMAEYFRDPEQTALTLREGWFFTGDLGYLDEDGWLYFVDRKKDVIRRGGENMSSMLIEKTLREHPSVLEAAVIGIPDPVLGQEVKAFIVAKEPVSEEELKQFAAERLARFQVPRLWEFRDSLPKTPSQRVEKYKLRAEAGGGKPMLG